MIITNNSYSVAELRDMLARKELIVNDSYQRGSGLWPAGARSYFIDTMLMKFPFPKIYFFESLDREQRKTIREIVDGQQRINSIIAFLSNKYRLTSVSRKFEGCKFSDLPEDVQLEFLSYSVPVDVIRNADQSEILEMFRRMNAYTLPLNGSEKRHSRFHGLFKWFINTQSDQLAATFVNFKVFSNRQIVRMADAELLAEMILSCEQGVISISENILSGIYKKYDDAFDREEEYGERLQNFFSFVNQYLSDFKGSFLMKPYVLHTLFCAMEHNRVGLPGLEEEVGLSPIGEYCPDIETAKEQLRALAWAHESKDIEGEYKEYVEASSSATTRKPGRLTRVTYLAKALRGTLKA